MVFMYIRILCWTYILEYNIEVQSMRSNMIGICMFGNYIFDSCLPFTQVQCRTYLVYVSLQICIIECNVDEIHDLLQERIRDQIYVWSNIMSIKICDLTLFNNNMNDVGLAARLDRRTIPSDWLEVQTGIASWAISSETPGRSTRRVMSWHL